MTDVCVDEQHRSYHKELHHVMVASNQLGYINMGEKAGFYPEFVVTINCTCSSFAGIVAEFKIQG